MNDRLSHLPPMRLTLTEFERLPEYSCSLPTGTTIGKRWRREDGAVDRAFLARGGKPRWMIGEYVRDRIVPAYPGEGRGVGDRDPANPDGPLINHQCRIKAVTEIQWYRPVIRVPAGSAPRAAG